MTRNEVLIKAVTECLKELYSFVQPKIKWEDFIEENKRYESNQEGPAPYEFYYLPKEIMDEICESYIDAYRIDQHQELLNTISILKIYCREPIVDKYIEGGIDENGNYHSGHRGYDNPDNLEKEIKKILGDIAEDNEYYQHKLQDKFFEFLDMAGNFYKWDGELNSFKTTVYLGCSPNSDKNTVIKNWKEYRNQDIKIDEKQIKKEYYGEDF